jgi:hypothetical protein
METRDLDDSVTLEDEVERFGEEMKDVMRAFMGNPERDTRKLRLSQIGKPDRQIFLAAKGIKGEDIKGATFIKFLYGHLVEAMMVSLVRMSGHSVTDQQKTVELEGVKGHIDGRIDGVLMDVKSASGQSFKKFRDSTLHKSDPFGYIGQLKAYAEAEGDSTYGWLAMCKQSGQIAWLQYDQSDTKANYFDAIDWSASERVRHVKKLVGLEATPSKCYPDLPVGNSGNRKLDIGCTFCPFKFHCWDGLRAFQYANYTEYLTVVDKEPRVVEVPHGF